MTLEAALRWAGGGLQILGVLTVAATIRSTRAALGRDSTWQRAKRWTISRWNRLTGRRPPPITGSGAIHGPSVTIFGTGTVSAALSADESIEAQVARLQGEVKSLRNDLRAARDDLSTRLMEQRDKLTEAIAAVSTSLRALDARVETLTGGSLRISSWGVGFFLAGLGVQTLAPELATFLASL